MRPLILVCVMVVLASGAGPQKKAEPKPAPLPPLNAKVYEFAKANLGQPVGDGICITLAREALINAGAKTSDFREPNADYTWGEPIADFKDVLPGDILQFRDASFRGKRSIGGGRILSWHQDYPHHTAVVAKVEKSGRLITIYHQNVTTQGQKESDKGNVQEGELRMESLQKGGWIKAYRPVPAEEVPARRPFFDGDDSRP